MKIPTVQPTSYLAWPWSPGNSFSPKTGLPKVIPIQTVPLAKAVFKHAGLGLSARTTRMLGKVASYLGDNPSGMLGISDYLSDTSKTSLSSSRARINLVKAYLATQGIDVPRFAIKGSSVTRRLVSRMALGTELIIEITGLHRLGRVDSKVTLPAGKDAEAGTVRRGENPGALSGIHPADSSREETVRLDSLEPEGGPA